MTMRAKQDVGTKYAPALDAAAIRNQNALLDSLTTPHPERMAEMIASPHKIVSTVAAYEHDAQPVQARGRICWNRAYAFQPHGPSYIDPVPDPR